MKIVSTLFMTLIVWSLQAQTIHEPITIGIFKPKKFQSLYRFNNQQLSQVSIKSIGPKKKTYTGNEVGQDIVNDLLAMALPGLRTGSVKDMEWELNGKLLSNNDSLNWNVILFCSGEFEKEKERIKNDDGSVSVQTTKLMHVNWEEGATGVILENEVPIAKFGVFMNPREDSLIYTSYKEAFVEPFEPIESASKNPFYLDAINSRLVEYAVLGEFRGEQFTLIANGDSRKMWFYINNQLQWIFRPDLDELPIKKKDRITPWLQVENNTPADKMQDWYRMALASKYMSTTLAINTYTN